MTAGTIELSCGETRAVVCPAIGGAVARYSWRGIDVLRPAPEAAIAAGRVREMGCFALVPYSNRIGDARLSCAAGELALRPNFPPEPHAIHGVGWQRPWRCSAHTSTSLREELAHEADSDWPFRFEAWQTVSLGENHLEIRLGMRNTDTRAMPAGLGFHPYFPLRPGVHLQAHWDAMWEMGMDRLPTGRVPVPPEADYRASRDVEHWRVDHCFSGWQRRARLEYPSHTLELTASEALQHIVCFAPADGRAFLALEPVSHANNAFAMSARGVADTGARLLSPGETWEAGMRLAVAQA